MDHDTFHPGIWMSFGDISGSDYWRIMARVRHAEFVDEPHGGPGKGSFAVRNEYLDQKDPSKVVCNEIARYTFLVRPAGLLAPVGLDILRPITSFILATKRKWASAFAWRRRCGLAQAVKVICRLATATILDSEGRKNEKRNMGQLSQVVRLQRHHGWSARSA